MRITLVIVSTCLLLLGCQEKHELNSQPVALDGPAVGEVYVEIYTPKKGTTFSSSHGHSDRWIGGKTSSGGLLPAPYVRNWWFDLILPDGTNEGSALIGWDPTEKKGFALCRSWQDIDLRFVTSTGNVIRLEHRPKN